MAKSASSPRDYFFEFRQNPLSHEWSIIAPRRATRPDFEKGEKFKCPFCPGNEGKGFQELWRYPEKGKGDWKVRIIPNKFPFAPIHEIVIHTRKHTSDWVSFKKGEVEKIFEVYRDRYQLHEREGQVFIFHNHGHTAGESIPHIHTQIAVLPKNFLLDIPMLGVEENVFKRSKSFNLFCPCNSSWPWEVWIAPRKRNHRFGEITNSEVKELASLFVNLRQKMEKFLGKNFSFNFYIYPGVDWYFRIIPRQKTPGGFEVGTRIFINTVDPVWAAKKLA